MQQSPSTSTSRSQFQFQEHDLNDEKTLRMLNKSITGIDEPEINEPSKDFLAREQARKEALEQEKQIALEKQLEKQRLIEEIARRKRDELLFKLNVKANERLMVPETDPSREIDVVFVRDFLVPYLSDVYYSIQNIEGLGYVREEVIKIYCNLPEIIGVRLMQLMNANSDPLIDHDEWLEYLLMLLSGNFQRKLFIVFQIFDLNNDEVLRPEHMKLILKHLPIRPDHVRYGISHETQNDAHFLRNELQREKNIDSKDVEQFVDIFFTDHNQGMLFKVFKERIMTISSEPYFAIISQFQEHIPCFQNFLRARSNFRKLAEKNSSLELQFKCEKIAMPSLLKSKMRLCEKQNKLPMWFNKAQSQTAVVPEEKKFLHKEIQMHSSTKDVKQVSIAEADSQEQNNLKAKAQIKSKQEILINKKASILHSELVIEEENSSNFSTSQGRVGPTAPDSRLDTILRTSMLTTPFDRSLIKSKDSDSLSGVSKNEEKRSKTHVSQKNRSINEDPSSRSYSQHELDNRKRTINVKKPLKFQVNRHKTFQDNQLKVPIEIREKDFGLDISSLKQKTYQVTDEFSMPFKSLPARISGPFVQFTKTGYYKPSWAIINGNELYIYQNKDNPKHVSLLVLYGARISCNTNFDGTVEVKGNPKYSRLFVIKISQGHGDAITMTSMFFEKLQTTLEWKKALIEASGNFKLYDFYDVQDKPTDLPIAEGQRCHVYKGIHKVQKVEVAIKKVSKEHVKDRTEIMREVDLMKLSVHQYTARLLDFFEDEKDYHLVIELEPGGSLFQYLAERKNFIKEDRAREIAQKIGQAVEYMHDYGIILSQLDLENIMMNDKSDGAMPRISKFSKARIIYPGQTIKQLSKNPLGKILYWSPELCNEQPYDTKIDIWSFGVIVFYLLSGQYHVTQRKDNQYQKKEIIEKEIYLRPLEARNISVQGIDFIKKCLTKEPHKRPSMKQILQHQWFKTILD